jgi:hypothetical protein
MKWPWPDFFCGVSPVCSDLYPSVFFEMRSTWKQDNQSPKSTILTPALSEQRACKSCVCKQMGSICFGSAVFHRHEVKNMLLLKCRGSHQLSVGCKFSWWLAMIEGCSGTELAHNVCGDTKRSYEAGFALPPRITCTRQMLAYSAPPRKIPFFRAIPGLPDLSRPPARNLLLAATCLALLVPCKASPR